MSDAYALRATPPRFFSLAGWNAFAANRWFFAAICAYVASAYAAAVFFGLADRFSLSIYKVPMVMVMAACIATVIIGHAIYVMVAVRPLHLTRHLVEEYRTRLFSSERLLTGLPVLLVLPVISGTFTSIKLMIPHIQPYRWDSAFIAWDRWLHFGYQPWELLQSVIGFPAATWLLNAGYHAWFFILYVSFFAASFSLTRPKLRAQFLLALLMTWALVGNLGGTLFASVGPCFYGLLTGAPTPFDPLMDYLRGIEGDPMLPALFVQAYLWESYVADGAAIGGGISAMPSIHVATALLFALLWSRINKWIGRLMWAYLVVIMAGSVHLAWHYAVDGYVAIAATLAIWHILGRLLARDGKLNDLDAGTKMVS